MKMIIPTGDHIGKGDPLKEEAIQIQVEGHPIEGYIPIGMEGLLEEQDPLMVEGKSMEMEVHLMEMEDPLMMENPLDILVMRTTRPSRTLGPVRPVIVLTPQVTLDTSPLQNTFDSVGQSKLQLARAQNQTHRQLQQHIQQGQLTMQAHTAA